jgi:hypothetical protein
MGKPHKGFSKLAKFASMEFEEASERFHFDETDDEPPDGFGIAISDAFGDDPEEVFVIEGDVTCAGDLKIGSIGDYAGVYVIVGNLTVAGVLDFTQVDGAAILLVTGSLSAKTVGVSQEAQLWVAKNVEASDYIIVDTSDAGGLAAKGTASAKALISIGRMPFHIGKKPKAATKIVMRDDTPSKLAAPFNDESVRYDALMNAARKGTALMK